MKKLDQFGSPLSDDDKQNVYKERIAKWDQRIRMWSKDHKQPVPPPIIEDAKGEWRWANRKDRRAAMKSYGKK